MLAILDNGYVTNQVISIDGGMSGMSQIWGLHKDGSCSGSASRVAAER